MRYMQMQRTTSASAGRSQMQRTSRASAGRRQMLYHRAKIRRVESALHADVGMVTCTTCCILHYVPPPINFTVFSTTPRAFGHTQGRASGSQRLRGIKYPRRIGIDREDPGNAAPGCEVVNFEATAINAHHFHCCPSTVAKTKSIGRCAAHS